MSDKLEMAQGRDLPVISALVGNQADAPLIVGIAGAVNLESTAYLALNAALEFIRRMGGKTAMIAGEDLNIPHYSQNGVQRSDGILGMLDLMRNANGLIIASPTYHGSIPGILKNVLDYVEDLRNEAQPYFEGRAIGCIATGQGWQGPVATLSNLRAIAHALRGWPTPLGVVVNSAEKPLFDADGKCVNVKLQLQLEIMASQVFRFSHMVGSRSSA